MQTTINLKVTKVLNKYSYLQVYACASSPLAMRSLWFFPTQHDAGAVGTHLQPLSCPAALLEWDILRCVLPKNPHERPKATTHSAAQL